MFIQQEKSLKLTNDYRVFFAVLIIKVAKSVEHFVYHLMLVANVVRIVRNMVAIA